MADEPLDTTFQSVYDEQTGKPGTQITSQDQAGAMIDNYVMAYTDDENHIQADQATINSAASTQAEIKAAKKDMAGAQIAADAAQTDASRVQTALDNLLTNNQNSAVDTGNPNSPTGGTTSTGATGVLGASAPAASAASSTPTDLGSGGSVPLPTGGVAASATDPGTNSNSSTPTDLGSGGSVPPSTDATPAAVPGSVTNPNSPTFGTTSTGTTQIQIHHGDTLDGLAKQYGVSVEAILEANKDITNPEVIISGRSLNMPVGGSVASGDGSSAGVTSNNGTELASGLRSRLTNLFRGKKSGNQGSADGMQPPGDPAGKALGDAHEHHRPHKPTGDSGQQSGSA